MTILVLVRGDAEDVTLTEYLLIYILSPMPAFDLILKGDLSFNVTPGAATFSSIVKVLDVMGLGIISNILMLLDGRMFHYLPMCIQICLIIMLILDTGAFFVCYSCWNCLGDFI